MGNHKENWHVKRAKKSVLEINKNINKAALAVIEDPEWGGSLLSQQIAKLVEAKVKPEVERDSGGLITSVKFHKCTGISLIERSDIEIYEEAREKNRN